MITKDSNVVQLLEQYRTPPKVLWINCGNTSNARMREILSGVMNESEPRNQSIDMTRSKKDLPERMLKAAETAALRELPGLVRDPELEQMLRTIYGRPKDAFLLPDGRVLVTDRDRISGGVLSQSRDIAINSIRESQAERNAVDSLMAPVASLDFVNRVPEYISSLSKRLDLPVAQLMSDVDDYRALQRRLRETGLDKEPLNIYAELIAFIGEQVKLASGGRWEMIRSRPAGPLDPVIIGSDGKLYALRAKLHDMLFEEQRPIKIYDIIHFTLVMGNRNHESPGGFGVMP